MFGIKKQKIRWKKTERLILPNVFQRFCRQCQTEQFFVSTEQATFLTNLTARQIFRLVEINTVHFFETKEGFLFICESSLKESLQRQQIEKKENRLRNRRRKL